MAQYSITGGATLIARDGDMLAQRVGQALLKKAAARYVDQEVPATLEERNYITRIVNDTVNEASRAVALIVALCNVASPGTDEVPVAMVDGELFATVEALWGFFTSGA